MGLGMWLGYGPGIWDWEWVGIWDWDRGLGTQGILAQNKQYGTNDYLGKKISLLTWSIITAPDVYYCNEKVRDVVKVNAVIFLNNNW